MPHLPDHPDDERDDDEPTAGHDGRGDEPDGGQGDEPSATGDGDEGPDAADHPEPDVDPFDELDLPDLPDWTFGDEDPGLPLDDHESAMVQQDLSDLEAFEETFRAEGYRGVSVFCRDCEVEHYYPWELLRENLRMLLETGETPVHEPAFDPDPAHYVPWEYARGYVDALHETGVTARIHVDNCPTCGFELDGDLFGANFCPRCSTPLVAARLAEALAARGASEDDIRAILHEIGIPG